MLSKDHSLSTYLVIAIGIVTLFFIIELFQLFQNSIYNPLYDFDEAHRAETARQMRATGNWISPITGSSFDRVQFLEVPFYDNPQLHLYYHLERPFLVYLLMIGSTSLFGEQEIFYRLPSMIFALATLGVFIFFAKKFGLNVVALLIGLVGLLTSADLWLSGQYAQLDTTLTFFLLSAVLSLLYFCQNKQMKYLIASGLCFAGAVLSKGQPAIIFIYPLLFVLITRRMTFKNFMVFGLSAAILLVPWVSYISARFGFWNFWNIFSGFLVSVASEKYPFHQAPFYWYLRWWGESFRPGVVFAISLAISTIIQRRFDWSMKMLASYIIGGLVMLSLYQNKIWWYVLPLVPAICFLSYLMVKQYLEKFPQKLLNVCLVLIIAGLPILMGASNSIGLLYELLLIIIGIYIFQTNRLESFEKNLHIGKKMLAASLAIVLVAFVIRFPSAPPFLEEEKSVAQYYQQLPGDNCLLVDSMPQESILFYSQAGEVLTYYGGDVPSYPNNCHKYLITGEDLTDNRLARLPYKKVIYENGQLRLIRLSPDDGK